MKLELERIAGDVEAYTVRSSQQADGGHLVIGRVQRLSESEWTMTAGAGSGDDLVSFRVQATTAEELREVMGKRFGAVRAEVVTADMVSRLTSGVLRELNVFACSTGMLPGHIMGITEELARLQVEDVSDKDGFLDNVRSIVQDHVRELNKRSEMVDRLQEMAKEVMAEREGGGLH